jgi:hypothetical protein
MGKLFRIFALVVFACFFGTAYADQASTAPKASEDVGWTFGGRLIHPLCFTRLWLSYDNFEFFEDVYQIPKDDCWNSEYKTVRKADSPNDCIYDFSKKLRTDTGLFFGKEIKDYTPKENGWPPKTPGSCDDLTATSCSSSPVKSLRLCNPEKFELTRWPQHIDSWERTVVAKTPLCEGCDFGFEEDVYEIIRPVDLKTCSSLAPNIGADCIESYLVSRGNWGGGSRGHRYVLGIYGIFDLPEVGLSVAPLKFFEDRSSANNFLD